MADYVKDKLNDGLHFLFPKNCFEEIVLKLDVFNRECVPLVASRGLGLAITLGSILLFVPQILKIHRARSGEGISLVGILIGLIPAIGTCAYSYEKQFVFSQYGDSFFVALQMGIIVMQILHFSDQTPYAFAFLATFWSIGCAIFYHYVPFEVLYSLQAFGIGFIVVSKGLQITANYKASSTGQLAFLTVALQFGGCLARVFTTITEANDPLVLASFLVGTLFNGIIFAQFLLYWNNEHHKKE